MSYASHTNTVGSILRLARLTRDEIIRTGNRAPITAADADALESARMEIERFLDHGPRVDAGTECDLAAIVARINSRLEWAEYV